MKRLISFFLAIFLLASVLCACEEKEAAGVSHNDAGIETKTYTAEEITAAMEVGWNLGNTLDAPDGETSWGQPETTEEMIDKIAELGFRTLRLPTSWGKHTSGKPDYKIDKKWLDRVQTIVDWALENDMFVILNSHHDNDYYYPSEENAEEAEKYITAIWSQVAERFKDYDQHLIFEAMNEPRQSGTANEWNFDSRNVECLKAAKVINSCNQACVNAVRAAGGRNTDRYIMVTPYAASPYSALADEFQLPEDSSNKLLLSIHAYTPYNLAMNKDLKIREFDDGCKRDINDFIDKIYNKFVKNGTYVVIGEMGCTNKSNDEARYEWGKYFVSKARENNMPCVVWDNQHDDIGEECYALFNRTALEVFPDCQRYYEGILAGLK